MTDRMDRVQEMVRREVAHILNEELSDPRIKSLTITRVEMTRDLRIAKVFCEFPDNEEEKKAILKGLKSARTFVRSQLAKRISLKFIPRISFREDTYNKKEREIDIIFDKIKEEKNEIRGDEHEH